MVWRAAESCSESGTTERATMVERTIVLGSGTTGEASHV